MNSKICGWLLYDFAIHPLPHTTYYLMGYALCRRPPIIIHFFKITVPGTSTCYFACLVASLWRLGGPWDDPGSSGSTRKDYWFLVDLGTLFWEFFGTLDQNMCVMLVSRFLFLMVFLGTNLGILQGSYCKNQLAQKLEFAWLQGPFFMLLGGLGSLYFGCLVASLWRPGGPWGDPETLGSTRKDTLRSRLWFSLFSNRFRDPILKVCWVPWANKCVFCVLVFRLFFLVVLGFESGCPELEI